MGLDKNAPIGYMQRTREYYLGLGYDNPYQWANFTDVPFVKPAKALAKMCIAIVTTCLLYTSPSPRDATLSRMPSSA